VSAVKPVTEDETTATGLLLGYARDLARWGDGLAERAKVAKAAC
jgi:hypothetical protein